MGNALKSKAESMAEEAVKKFLDETPGASDVFNEDELKALRAFFVLWFSEGHHFAVMTAQNALRWTQEWPSIIVPNKPEYAQILEMASAKNTQRMCGEYPADNQF